MHGAADGTRLAGASTVGVATYQPRDAQGSILHRVVRENLETFLREAAERTDDGGLPRFVEREFREFLTCGALGRGFARVRCENCAFERVFSVSFSWSAGLCGRLMRQGCPKGPSSTRAVSGQGVGTCDLRGQHTQRDPRQGEEEDDPDGRRVAHRRVARYSCFLRVRSQHMEPTPGGDGSKGEVRCAPSPGIFSFLPVCPPRPSSRPAS